MQPSSTSITAALSTEEVCPLCLDRYTAADECTCVVCRAPSCPGCAETIDADGAMRCFACRPALALPRPALAARAPTPLPRPISPAAWNPAAAARVSAEPPPLPFPLTTSPRGVRALNPRPAGSVYVGLPPVSPALSHSLQSAPIAARAPSPPPGLALRAQAHVTQLQRQTQQLLRAWSARGQQRWQWARRELPIRAEQLAHWLEARRVRLGQLHKERVLPALGRLRSSLLQLQQRRLPQRGVAQVHAFTQSLRVRVPQLLAVWTQGTSTRLAKLHLPKPLAALSARLARPRALVPPPAAQRDRSSPISL